MATDLQAQHYNNLFKTGAFGIGGPRQGLGDTTYMSPQEGAAATQALNQYLIARDRNQFEAQQGAAQRAAENERARLQAETALAPLQQKERIFNQLMGQLFGGGGGLTGAPGGGRVNIQPFPGAGGGAGGQGMNFLNVPGQGLVAPPSIPGSALAPPPSNIPGASPPQQSGIGGGSWGGAFAGMPIDTTLPQFGPSPFSTNMQRGAENRFRAMNNQQEQTAERQAREQYAQSGGGLSRQGQARIGQIGQQARAGLQGGLGGIREQYGQARSGLELQQQGMLSQARRGINQLYPEYAKAQAAAQQPALGLFSSLLGAAF